MGVTAHVFCLLNPHLTHKTHTQTREKGNKERLRKAFVSTLASLRHQIVFVPFLNSNAGASHMLGLKSSIFVLKGINLSLSSCPPSQLFGLLEFK